MCDYQNFPWVLSKKFNSMKIIWTFPFIVNFKISLFILQVPTIHAANIFYLSNGFKNNTLQNFWNITEKLSLCNSIMLCIIMIWTVIWMGIAIHYDINAIPMCTVAKITLKEKMESFWPKKWSQFDSQYRGNFDSNILQLLGIPGRILFPRVTQLFGSKWLHFSFQCSTIALWPRTTVSQDVQTWFSVQLAFAKFLSKIKGNFWGSAVSMIRALY